MALLFTISRKPIASEAITIHCPMCGKEDMKATAVDSREKVRVFGLIPVFSYTQTFVKCACGAALLASARSAALAGMHGDDLRALIRIRIPLVLRFLAVVGAVFCFLPVIGFAWTSGTWIWVRKYGGWMLTLTRIAWYISVASTVALIVTLVLERFGFIE